MPKITLVQGDITKQEVDAIVNAANRELEDGLGVSGAIHDAGGPEIHEQCMRVRAERYPDGVPTGQAVATDAGNLPAHWVIHAVGPIYSGSEDDARLLRDCYINSLEAADGLGAETVSFPAISAGIYGYPLEAAAAAALTAIANASTDVGEVRFVLYSEAALEDFRMTAERMGIEVHLE